MVIAVFGLGFQTSTTALRDKNSLRQTNETPAPLVLSGSVSEGTAKVYVGHLDLETWKKQDASARRASAQRIRDNLAFDSIHDGIFYAGSDIAIEIRRGKTKVLLGASQ